MKFKIPLINKMKSNVALNQIPKEGVDFLKINTKPVHRDPAGIYMFPDDVLKKIQSY